MTKFDYKTDWQPYTYPESNMISNNSDIKEEFTAVDLTAKKFSASGIPILVKKHTAYVNASDENTILFGETGSKKTRSAILPLLAMTAGAHESAFVTDVKGELSANPKIQAFMKAHGINGVYLDFRTFSGDGYNLFEQPFNLYCKGQEDKAATMIRKFVDSLNSRFIQNNNDPFWSTSSTQLMTQLIMLLFQACATNTSRRDMMNMLTMNSYLNYATSRKLLELIDTGAFGDVDNDNRLIMLRGVLQNPDRTINCILSSAQGMIYDFTIQKDLMRMVSNSTFDVAAMYEKPTFVFLIIPDETSAYDTISGMLIDMFYSVLIEVYSEKYQGRKDPPCRINYICDEFCNLRINDMRAKISASRSRNMRWFLVCQSKQQLDSVYKEEAGTIIGNCKNIFFLQSSDPEMLSYMSELSGTTKIARTGSEEPLVSRDMLKSLKKEYEYKEALFVRDEIRYFAKLPDIDFLEFLQAYDSDEIFRFKKKFPESMRVLSIRMLEDIAQQLIKEKREAERAEKSKQKRSAPTKRKKPEPVQTDDDDDDDDKEVFEAADDDSDKDEPADNNNDSDDIDDDETDEQNYITQFLAVLEGDDDDDDDDDDGDDDDQ